MAKSIYMYVLGAILILGFLCLLTILVFKGIPPTNSDLLYLSVGALIGYAGAVVNYFFGSSLGSDKKTDIISKQNEPK